jgi:hypothetical protein
MDGIKTAIEELRVDSKIGKGKHFNASDRKLFWHRIFGLPVIVANLFVGIVLVSLQPTTSSNHLTFNPTTASTNSPAVTPAVSANSGKLVTPAREEKNMDVVHGNKEELEHENSSTKSRLGLASILFAFGAAALSAVQTFFNFHKSSEGHRAIGNRYVHISRQCKYLQQKNRDIPFSSEEYWKEYEKLYNEYHQINTEAEAFPTSSSDLNKAKKAVEISKYNAP